MCVCEQVSLILCTAVVSLSKRQHIDFAYGMCVCAYEVPYRSDDHCIIATELLCSVLRVYIVLVDFVGIKLVPICLIVQTCVVLHN